MSHSPLPSPKNPWTNKIQNKSNPLSTPMCSSPPPRTATRNHTSDLISIAWSFRCLGLVIICALVAGFLHRCFFLPLEWRWETTHPIRFPLPEAFAAWVWLESAPGLLGFALLLLSSSLFISSFWSLASLCDLWILLISTLLNRVHRARFLYDIFDFQAYMDRSSSSTVGTTRKSSMMYLIYNPKSTVKYSIC